MMVYRSDFTDFNNNYVNLGDTLETINGKRYELIFDSKLSEALENCETKTLEKARKADIKQMTIIKSRLNDDSEYEL